MLGSASIGSPASTPGRWKPQGRSISPDSPVSASQASPVRPKRPEKLRVATPARHSWSRVPFFTKWINALCQDPPGEEARTPWVPLDESNFFEELKTGLVLCKVVERLVPGVDLTTKGIYHKPRTRATCIANIEKALSVAWRTGVNAGNMCTADEIYDCKVTPVTRCITEIFEALQMRLREVRSRSREMLTSMNDRLVPTGCGLSKATLSDRGDSLVEDFADCTKIMALLVSVGRASPEELLALAHAEQTGSVRGNELDGLLEENARILSQVLEANGCPVLLGDKEFARPPPPFPDTLLLQLHLIWRMITSPDSASPLVCLTGSLAWPVSGAAGTDDVQAWMQLLSMEFSSLEEAYWSWCGNMSGRMSQSSFLRATKELQFQGDTKLVWDTLNRGVPGFVSVEDFARPELEASFAEILRSNSLEDEEANLDPDVEVNAEEAEEEAVEEDQNVEPEPGEEEEVEEVQVDPVEQVEFEVLLDVSPGPREISSDMIADACRKVHDEEPRFASAVEERTRLLHEDLRKQQELQEGGVVAARLVAAASAAACAACAQAVPLEPSTIEAGHDVLDQLPAMPEISELVKEMEQAAACGPGEETVDHINSLLAEIPPEELPAPTTSVDTQVILSDSSEARVRLQTNVVDRPDEAVPALVLELWACSACLGIEASPMASQLVSQVDCSKVIDIVQHGPLSGDLVFEILLIPGADFLQVDPRSLAIANTAAREGERHGPSELRHQSKLVDTRQQPSLFTEESAERGPLSCQCTFAQAPAWRKREAANFFDELRILTQFVQPKESNS
ncbi:unnamed protein product [Effrenium voratum]|nr:unnamed protein product [Effrenium voratum]